MFRADTISSTDLYAPRSMYKLHNTQISSFGVTPLSLVKYEYIGFTLFGNIVLIILSSAGSEIYDNLRRNRKQLLLYVTVYRLVVKFKDEIPEISF